MCLIALAWRAHPRFPLVIAANRDEFFARPTREAHFWADHPQVLAGRDLEAMGSWMGISRTGRFAALTNYRGPGERELDKASRGDLVADFLIGSDPAEVYLGTLRPERYNGFSLVVGDVAQALWVFSNRGPQPRALEPGVHVLSNHLMDTPWPKSQRLRARMEAALAPEDRNPGADRILEELLQALGDREQAKTQELPETGVGLELEQLLSPVFVAMPGYGTRCSTIILVNDQGMVRFQEITWNEEGREARRVEYSYFSSSSSSYSSSSSS